MNPLLTWALLHKAARATVRPKFSLFEYVCFFGVGTFIPLILGCYHKSNSSLFLALLIIPLLFLALGTKPLWDPRRRARSHLIELQDEFLLTRPEINETTTTVYTDSIDEPTIALLLPKALAIGQSMLFKAEVVPSYYFTKSSGVASRLLQLDFALIVWGFKEYIITPKRSPVFPQPLGEGITQDEHHFVLTVDVTNAELSKEVKYTAHSLAELAEEKARLDAWQDDGKPLYLVDHTFNGIKKDTYITHF